MATAGSCSVLVLRGCMQGQECSRAAGLRLSLIFPHVQKKCRTECYCIFGAPFSLNE